MPNPEAATALEVAAIGHAADNARKTRTTTADNLSDDLCKVPPYKVPLKYKPPA
jgi:hypothetical protein